MANEDLLLLHAESLQNMMVSIATGGSEKESEFARLRRSLLSDPSVDTHVPRFVKTCRTIQQFWSYIKQQSDKYDPRRQHIWAAFAPLLDHLQRSDNSPADALVSDVLTKYDAEHVAEAWRKALDRRSTDAEGAITSARTLLESVCKHVLDEEDIPYNDKDDLPKLYRLTSEKLNIAPSQHTEEVFRQILGGCTAAVEGLGTLRNRLSDAHGKGKIAAKPRPRHAELAVNLSGALATFVLQTWEDRGHKPAGSATLFKPL
jgi:hypothetical protein